MIETVECYANQDGEVIGNQLNCEKFTKRPYRCQRKEIFTLLKRPRRVPAYQSLFLNEISSFLTKDKTAYHVENE